MAEGHGSAVGRLDQVARAARRLRASGARLGAVAAALAAAVLAVASLLQAGAAAGAVATTTNTEAITGALVAPDGRHVVVPYLGGGCVVGAKLTATETGSKVTLVLRQLLSGASVCPADLIVGLDVSVTLPHPLWGRSLVDGSTGRPIPYFDGRKLLRVTYLPPGFRFSAYQPYPEPAVNAWEREFGSRGQATAPVEIEQVAGNTAVAPSWPVTARIKVGARPATLSVLTSGGQVFGRAIAWRAGGYAFVVYTVMVRAEQRLLSTAELARIADGLRS
ncbi:MAG TPA: hypothetical protein VIX15_11175 [Streptosporangiaceae bacterium]